MPDIVQLMDYRLFWFLSGAIPAVSLTLWFGEFWAFRRDKSVSPAALASKIYLVDVFYYDWHEGGLQDVVSFCFEAINLTGFPIKITKLDGVVGSKPEYGSAESRLSNPLELRDYMHERRFKSGECFEIVMNLRMTKEETTFLKGLMDQKNNFFPISLFDFKIQFGAEVGSNTVPFTVIGPKRIRFDIRTRHLTFADRRHLIFPDQS